jgi:phosphomethylpyrimidine synthase
MAQSRPPLLNVILGVTPGETTPEDEYEKATTAASLGVAMLTDVSTNRSSDLRRRILSTLDVVLGTVPTYEVHRRIRHDGQDARDAVMSVLERHAQDGVDWAVIHASSSPSDVAGLSVSGRRIPVTSRGGAMMLEIMARPDQRNPYLTCFDEVLDLCSSSGMALSLAATFRPGSVADALDLTHRREIDVQAELVRRAHARDVKVSVELLNHVPLNLIPAYCELGDMTFDGAPYGGLGPNPTDIAIGYDDVAGAIGAANAVMHGASNIACLTSGEHVHIPQYQEMIRAVKYFQLALHIGWSARTRDFGRDAELSDARNRNDWATMSKLALHGEDAHELIEHHGYHEGEACTMCRGACPLVRAQAISRESGLL